MIKLPGLGKCEEAPRATEANPILQIGIGDPQRKWYSQGENEEALG
jgi:hypothetical protein